MDNLSEKQKANIPEDIVAQMRRTLTARKFINIYGPLGIGTSTVCHETYGDDKIAEIDFEGGKDANIVTSETKYIENIPILYKDFLLDSRDINLSNTHDIPLDTSRAIRAAHFLAHREEILIYKGEEKLKICGLTNVNGRNKVKKNNWSKFGKAFENVLEATDILFKGDHHGPYAITMSPHLYAQLLKTDLSRPFLELDSIARLCTDGVYQSEALDENEAILVSTGSQNFDIVISEDANINYLMPKNMSHVFRVYESIALRIKRPSAICSFEL